MKLRPILLAMITCVLVASYAPAQTLRVSIQKAPIRKGPDARTELVTMATEGTVLELVDRDGLWYIVRVPQTQLVGYVHSALVEITSAPVSRPGPASPAPRSQPPVSAPIVQPCAPPPPPPPRRTSPPPPVARTPTEEPTRRRDETPTDTFDSYSEDAPWEARGFGIGMRTGWATLGSVAFNLRTWGETAGLSLDVSHLGDALDFGQLQMQPSVLFKIGQPITFDAVYLQPYAGGGGNVLWHHGSLASGFTLGIGAFGGLDVGFTAVPNLTVSADLGYISDDVWSNCEGICLDYWASGDVGLTIGIDWYFK